MARKSKRPQIVEDFGSAKIRLICPNHQCGHEFYKKGDWLEKNRTFGCPECGDSISFDDDQLTTLFSDHVKNVTDMLKRMGKVSRK